MQRGGNVKKLLSTIVLATLIALAGCQLPTTMNGKMQLFEIAYDEVMTTIEQHHQEGNLTPDQGANIARLLQQVNSARDLAYLAMAAEDPINFNSQMMNMQTMLNMLRNYLIDRRGVKDEHGYCSRYFADGYADCGARPG